MKSYVSIFVLFCLLFSCGEKQKPRVLVFSKTKGYRHESIDIGKLTLIELGQKNGFEVDTTENADFFNEETLKRYQAVIFLSTTMDVWILFNRQTSNVSLKPEVDLWESMLRQTPNMSGHGMENWWAHISKAILKPNKQS